MKVLEKKWVSYSLISLAIIVTIVVVAYGITTQLYKPFVTERTVEEKPLIKVDESKDTKPATFEAETLNILLMGTDKSGLRTDTMMVIHYNQKTKTTSLFSIPRDYRIEVSDELKELIHYRSDHMKMTEMHSYGKAADYSSPASLTTQVAEELMNIKIDHFVLINIAGFKKVVDSVGGVEVNVPQNLEYHDPSQDLHISLKAGLQTLDGEMAEQFVRFRQSNSHKGYGDFGRMEMQQYFLTAFVKKLFSANSIFNMTQIYASLTEFVTTDATLEDAIGILNTAKDADLKRVYAHTLPSVSETINGGSYQIPPPTEELIAFVQDTIESDKAPLEDSKQIPIKILNGTSKKDLTESTKEMLTLAGYTITDAVKYNGARTMRTRIVVPREGLGHDLKAYFEFSEVVVDPTQFKEEDPEMILVILGSIQP